MRARSLAPWLVLLAASTALPRRAEAQLHGDVDVEGGASARLLSSRPAGIGEPDPGPMALLSAHVALLPLVRAGGYVAFDASAIDGQGSRDLLGAGLSARLYSPWPRGLFRAWLGLGVGYVASRGPASLALPSATGGYAEVPLGLGASLRLSRRFELVGEAGTRIGFAFDGSMYNQPVGGRGPRPDGYDTLGVFLVLGLAFEL